MKTTLIAAGAAKSGRSVLVWLIAVLAGNTISWAEEPSSPSLAPVHVDWIDDLGVAQRKAKEEGKDLVLFFTGSDWCAFCIQMEEELLAKPETEKRLAKRYIPVVLDFPHETELPLLLTAQNEQIRRRLDVTGFPSIYFVDADLLPYGSLSGYHSPASFWKSYEQVAAVGADLAKIRQGKSIQEIDDAEQLDRLFRLIPRNQLEHGWLEQIERMTQLPDKADQALQQDWRRKLAEYRREIVRREFKTAFSLAIKGWVRQKNPPDEVFAQLEKFGVKAEGDVELLNLLQLFKAHYLFQLEQFDEAALVAEKLIESKSLTPERLAEMKLLTQRAREGEKSADAQESDATATIRLPRP